MMGKNLKLPVGVDDFKKIRRDKFYYIDKTKLLEQLLDSWGEVNLFTRPRRFGKTLNMSMLRYFFEIGTDESLFDGLYIKKNKKICEEYMGKFPVIFISLKNVEGSSFEHAKYQMMELIAKEAARYSVLRENEIERLTNGEVIEKELRLDLTYDEINQSIENLWSVLFTTGYLTQAGRSFNRSKSAVTRSIF